VRSTRGALPLFPPVGFPEPPPAPAVPVSGQRALHESRLGCVVSSSRDRPWGRDHCASVAVARRAHLRRVEQLPPRRARPATIGRRSSGGGVPSP
jgi:hypothetical protein